MKKIIMFALVVGFLILGTVTIGAKMSEKISSENNFSAGESFTAQEGSVSIDGGGDGPGGGGGGIPGSVLLDGGGGGPGGGDGGIPG